jgi:hypothetical protein
VALLLLGLVEESTRNTIVSSDIIVSVLWGTHLIVPVAFVVVISQKFRMSTSHSPSLLPLGRHGQYLPTKRRKRKLSLLTIVDNQLSGRVPLWRLPERK